MAIKFTGRPPKFQDPEELERVINQYFEDCEKDEEPFTVTGLAYTIGITPRKLRDYKDCVDDINILKQLDVADKVKLSDVVKRAYMVCERYAEACMLNPKNTKSPTGYIFALKNHGWVDKTEVTTTVQEKAPDLSGLSEEEIKAMLGEK